MQYIQGCMLTKQKYSWYLDAGHVQRMNFDSIRLSYACGINTSDLNPDINPENYGRPMELAIVPYI